MKLDYQLMANMNQKQQSNPKNFEIAHDLNTMNLCTHVWLKFIQNKSKQLKCISCISTLLLLPLLNLQSFELICYNCINGGMWEANANVIKSISQIKLQWVIHNNISNTRTHTSTLMPLSFFYIGWMLRIQNNKRDEWAKRQNSAENCINKMKCSRML